MLRTLISITLLGSCCLAAPAPAPAAGSGSQKTDLFMPDIQVKQDDGYMCIPMKLAQDKSVFITGFEPKADMSISHHIILYGCEEAGDESGKPFSCTQMDHASADAKPTCSKGSAIIYAWAMGAPSFELPKDVAFKVGKDTKIKTLVLQMHFKFNGTYKGGSGLSMNMQDQPTPKIAGIYLMATGGFLPAQSKVTLETACQYSLPNTLTPFAYRVHTHTNGVVVSGYRVRRGKWVELGRKNPQLPQMFYPLTTPNIDIKTNDVLASRCVMKNTGESDIAIGATKNDEMCNFYIMYSVPNTPESEAVLNDDNGCFSDGLPYDAAEWRRDFGILTGFPADSLKVPEGDAKLAKTMGDHMQMGGMQMGGMQMEGMQMSDDDEDTENEYDESAIRNYLERFDAEEDAGDDNDNEEENDIFALRKRHFAASSDESE